MHPSDEDKYVETEIARIEDKSVAGYNYGGEINCPDKLMKMEFTADEGVTLQSLRLEGENGAKWFKDGQIIDENGNPIDATQELNGLTIIIDLEASGLNVGSVNHLHGGDDGLTGAYSVVVKSMKEKGIDYASIMSSLVQDIVLVE